MPMNPHLVLKDVSKAVFRKVNETKVRTQILSGLSLEMQRGELITIMGASGSGKSTLLRLINRLSETDLGIIMLNGKDIRDYEPLQLRKKIGMVFQQPIVFRGSVRENIAFGMRLWQENIDIDALAANTAIPDRLLDADALPLSVGEKQRVCIARALANQPEVLLLDEPTSSLDAISAGTVEKLLLDLRAKKNLTMLWVTHEKEQAERIGGGRRMILRDGRLEHA